MRPFGEAPRRREPSPAAHQARLGNCMIKYIGSKRTLVPLIEHVVNRLPVQTAYDSSLGRRASVKRFVGPGSKFSQRHCGPIPKSLGLAYIVADEEVDRDQVRKVLQELAELPGKRLFTQAFCVDARYFQPDNGARIDAIRSEIDRSELDEVERGIVLTSLMEASDRVDTAPGSADGVPGRRGRRGRSTN